MTTIEIDFIIKKIVEKIVNEYKPQKIILFGSYAYGKPTEDSDIDFLIIKDEEQKEPADRFVDVKRIIYDRNVKIPVSPLVLTSEEIKKRLDMGDDFIEEILTIGKVLYERENS